MRILGLENRCTGNRTVGSNPTLSANYALMLLTYNEILPEPPDNLQFCIQRLTGNKRQSFLPVFPLAPQKRPRYLSQRESANRLSRGAALATELMLQRKLQHLASIMATSALLTAGLT